VKLAPKNISGTKQIWRKTTHECVTGGWSRSLTEFTSK